MPFLLTFVDLLFRILQLLVFARVLLSWMGPDMRYRSGLVRMIYQLTDPIIEPLRPYTTFGMIDFSPFVALILLSILQTFLRRIIISYA